MTTTKRRPPPKYSASFAPAAACTWSTSPSKHTLTGRTTSMRSWPGACSNPGTWRTAAAKRSSICSPRPASNALRRPHGVIRSWASTTTSGPPARVDNRPLGTPTPLAELPGGAAIRSARQLLIRPAQPCSVDVECGVVDDERSLKRGVLAAGELQRDALADVRGQVVAVLGIAADGVEVGEGRQGRQHGAG